MILLDASFENSSSSGVVASTNKKNRAIKRGYNNILPDLQPGDHHGNSCSSLIQGTATHKLGLDFLKEHDWLGPELIHPHRIILAVM